MDDPRSTADLAATQAKLLMVDFPGAVGIATVLLDGKVAVIPIFNGGEVNINANPHYTDHDLRPSAILPDTRMKSQTVTITVGSGSIPQGTLAALQALVDP